MEDVNWWLMALSFLLGLLLTFALMISTAAVVRDLRGWACLRW